VEIHGGPVFYYSGIYFSLLQMLDFGDGGTMPGELALSRDGIRWNRPFRGNYFLPVTGTKKEFDAGCLWTNATPVILDDEIRFYYGAYPSWGSDVDDQAGTGIGMRTLPRDRFAGVRPLDKVGQITLRPLDLANASKLTINANAAEGAVRVEVLTEAGYRLGGFTKEDATPIQSDGLRHAVAWKEKSLADLPQGRYRLRIYLDKAEVFALTLHD
jgi:hypothetical protein